MHWQVPMISQRTLNVCWEACGHMLWGWRYKKNPQRLASYPQHAGAYATLNQGLTEQEMDRTND